MRRASRAGFTLIEMLAVMALVALIATLSTQLARPPSPRLRVEAAARALCAAARATRARAIASNEDARLVVDLARKTFSSSAVATTALPGDAHIDVTIANAQREAGDGVGVVFFPGGGSTGGEITLEIAGNRASVDVNWLTGETRCGLV
jgi:general secretion pathway protein H